MLHRYETDGAEIYRQSFATIRREAALELLEKSDKPDLLISDVGLPGSMNGRQMVDAA